MNPVQCSAAGMDPVVLKRKFGEQIVFLGGGVDTQHTLPFGTPDEVRQQVRERIRAFGPGGGFVFNLSTTSSPKSRSRICWRCTRRCGVRKLSDHLGKSDVRWLDD